MINASNEAKQFVLDQLATGRLDQHNLLSIVGAAIGLAVLAAITFTPTVSWRWMPVLERCWPMCNPLSTSGRHYNAGARARPNDCLSKSRRTL